MINISYYYEYYCIDKRQYLPSNIELLFNMGFEIRKNKCIFGEKLLITIAQLYLKTKTDNVITVTITI